MFMAVAEIESISPYSWSKYVDEPKLSDESGSDYEKRIWQKRAHVNADGNLFIPAMAFKFSIEGAASMLRMRVKGKGHSEYGKRMQAGLIISDDVVLPDTLATMDKVTILAHANGKRGPGARVPRTFPMVPKWKGQLKILVISEDISEDVLRTHIEKAGMLVGVGRFRPQNSGTNGRFKLNKLTWEPYV